MSNHTKPGGLQEQVHFKPMKQVNITHAVRASQNLLAVTHGVAWSG